MALNQTGLDPLSRPGTVFTGLGANPFEVWQKRAELEGKQAAADAAKKAAEDKAKKDMLDAGKFEFGEVYRPHTDEFMNLGQQFIAADAARMQRFNQTKNPDDDPFLFGSTAYKEREKQKLGIQQYSNYSKQQKQFAEKIQAEQAATPGKYTQEDLDLAAMITEMSPIEAMKNGVELNPNLLGHWDKNKVLTEAKGMLEAEKFGNAWYDEANDMIVTPDGERVTANRFKELAVGLAAPGSANGMRWLLEYKKSSPEEQKRLDGVAEQMSKQLGVPVTGAQAKAWEDFKPLVRESSQSRRSNAGQRDTGWRDNDEEADRIVRLMEGISNNDGEVMEILFAGSTPSRPGQKGAGVVVGSSTDEFIGMPLPKYLTEDGKEVSTYAGRIVVKEDGILEMERLKGDGTVAGIITVPQKDFLSTMTEMVIEGSPELKRSSFYRTLKKRGRITEGGYIKSGENQGNQVGEFIGIDQYERPTGGGKSGSGGAFVPGQNNTGGGPFVPKK